MVFLKFVIAILIFYVGIFIMNFIGMALVVSVFRNKISRTATSAIGYFIGYVIPLYFGSLVLVNINKPVVLAYLIILGSYDVYRTIKDPTLISTYTEDVRNGHILGSSVAFLTLIIVFALI